MIDLLNLKDVIFQVLCDEHVHHMCVELRIGKDFVASGVVLLAKLKLFDGRGLPERLHNAYKMYLEWCSQHGKNTNIDDFSKREFKMATTLGLYIDRFMHTMQPTNEFIHHSLQPFARNNAFPTATGGKGADTSIVSAWLEHCMDGMEIWLMYIGEVDRAAFCHRSPLNNFGSSS